MLTVKVKKEITTYPDKKVYSIKVYMEISSSAFETYTREHLVYLGDNENIADQIQKDLLITKFW